MEYIDKLNRLRYEKGLSFRQLGLDCKLSESAVKKILYKKCDPRMSSIEKICTVLGTSIPDLFSTANKLQPEKIYGDDSFIAVCAPLPADAKSHVMQFVNGLCK